MVYFLYNLLLSLATILALPVLLVFILITGRYKESLGQRFGFVSWRVLNDASLRPRLWIHACSVGEVSVISPIITEIKKIYPSSCIIVSNTTKTGHDFAKQVLRDVSSYMYFPLDFWWVVGRALRVVIPDIFIVSETEIWPNFLRKARKLGVKTIMVNGRISMGSFGGYMKVRPLMKQALQNLDVMSMIGKDDARRIVSMGASQERVFVNGNSKYDGLADHVHPDFEEDIRKTLNISGDDKVFVAGSTRKGEDEIIIEAYLKFVKVYPDMLMVIAPRHIERTGEVEKLLCQNNLGFILKTDLDAGVVRNRQVILLNTIGDLSKVYSVGTIVFCGASLVTLGGHNVLEAAAWGKVVFYGPSMENFLDAKQLLETVGAGIEINGADDLVEVGLELLEDVERLHSLGEAGRRVVMANRGAAKRSAMLVQKLLEGKI